MYVKTLLKGTLTSHSTSSYDPFVSWKIKLSRTEVSVFPIWSLDKRPKRLYTSNVKLDTMKISFIRRQTEISTFDRFLQNDL